MISENSSTTPEPNFTESQRELLGALRSRYQQDRDLFTGRELSRLRFMRWLQVHHPVTEDPEGDQLRQMPIPPGGMPLAADSGGTPWCVS